MRIYDGLQFTNPADEISSLFASAGRTSFFSLAGWYEIVARQGLEPGWRPRIYAGEGVRAALAGMVRAANEREIHGACNMYSCEHAILIDGTAQETPHEVRKLFAELGGGARASFVRLPGLDPKDPSFAAALLGLKDAGFLVKPYFCWGVWHEPAEGCDFAAYVANRPSMLKNTWRRKESALGKAARVAFRTSDGDVERFIADYDDVCRRSWKQQEPFPEFIPSLIRLAAKEGALRYGVLVADDMPIAAQFWIVWAGRATIYKLAYDRKWDRFSPGTLLTMHMIRHVLERDRPSEIDFGRGDDGYKKLWMSRRRERWGIEAADPRTVRGLARGVRLVAGLGRDYFRKRRVPG